jgi:hypothetical protein
LVAALGVISTVFASLLHLLERLLLLGRQNCFNLAAAIFPD